MDGRWAMPSSISPPASGARLIDASSRIIKTRAPKFMWFPITGIGRPVGQPVWAGGGEVVWNQPRVGETEGGKRRLVPPVPALRLARATTRCLKRTLSSISRTVGLQTVPALLSESINWQVFAHDVAMSNAGHTQHLHGHQNTRAGLNHLTYLTPSTLKVLSDRTRHLQSR